MIEKKTEKKPRKQNYTVTCNNIYIDGVKRLQGETVELYAAEAKSILDGDEEAGRKPRLSK